MVRGNILFHFPLRPGHLLKCLKTEFCHAYSDVFKFGESWIIYNLQRNIWLYFSLSFHFKESIFLLVHFPSYCRILRLNYKIHGNESKKNKSNKLMGFSYVNYELFNFYNFCTHLNMNDKIWFLDNLISSTKMAGKYDTNYFLQHYFFICFQSS